MGSLDLATLLALLAQLPNLCCLVLRWGRIDDNHVCAQSHCSEIRRIKMLHLYPRSLTDNSYLEFLAILHVFAEIDTLLVDLGVRTQLSKSGSLRCHPVLSDTTRPIVVRNLLLVAPDLDIPEANHPYQFFQRYFATGALRCFTLQAARGDPVVACSSFLRDVGRSLETLSLDFMLADWDFQPAISECIHFASKDVLYRSSLVRSGSSPRTQVFYLVLCQSPVAFTPF